MAETLGRRGLWHLVLVEKDLVEQAGLQQEDIEYELTHLSYKERRMVLSHIYNKELVVSLQGEDDSVLAELVKGFSTVVGYEPFCKYRLSVSGRSDIPPTPTYEWDKQDPKARYQELQEKENISDLTLLVSLEQYQDV